MRLKSWQIIVLSGLLYLGLFTVRFPLPSTYAIIPPLDYAKFTSYSALSLISYIGGIGLLFVLYGLLLQQLRAASDFNHKSFVAGILFLPLTLLLSYPVLAIDLFVYAIRTRGWAQYGLNPLSTPPEQLPPTDPWLGLAAEWVDAASPYGPVWEGLSLAGFYLAQGDFLLHLIWLKLVVIISYWLTTWLIYRILHTSTPKLAWFGTAVWAFNPLVLLEVAQNGHNDILMTMFLVATVWATQQGRKHSSRQHRWFGLAILLFAMSILVKFVTVILTPFLLIALTVGRRWPERIGVILGYGAVLGIIVGLGMWPLWPGWDRWAVLNAGSGAGRSLLALLVLSLGKVVSLNMAFDLAQNGIVLILGSIYLYQLGLALWDGWSATTRLDEEALRERFILPAFTILCWYVMLGSPVFHGWYLLWFVPLAVLLWPSHRRPARVSIIFSITALLIIPYFETIRVWYPTYLLQDQLVGHLIGVPLLLLPPLIGMMWPEQ